MKITIMSSLALFGIAFAQDLRVDNGSIFFQGESRKGVFVARNFQLAKKAEGVNVKTKAGEVLIKTNLNILTDTVVSENGKAVALLFREQSVESFELYSAKVGGPIQTYSFQSDEMTDDFDWIVEIGAVSEGGVYLLLKCGKLMPVKNGRQRVGHSWVIAKIEKNVLTISEKDAGIDKWHKYQGK